MNNILFKNIKIKLCKNMFVSQQYTCTAWSDCMEVRVGMSLYCWQRLITFGVSRIKVFKMKAAKYICPALIWNNFARALDQNLKYVYI